VRLDVTVAASEPAIALARERHRLRLLCPPRAAAYLPPPLLPGQSFRCAATWRFRACCRPFRRGLLLLLLLLLLLMLLLLLLLRLLPSLLRLLGNQRVGAADGTAVGAAVGVELGKVDPDVGLGVGAAAGRHR
jgi:hypothetical protein